MSTFSTTHEGLERVLEGTRVISDSVGPSRSLRTIPLIVLTGIISAVLAIASRQFADVMPEGLTGEWLATWGVGAFAALVFARIATRIAHAMVRTARAFGAQSAQARTEQAYREAARLDPRLMADLRAAISRAEQD